MKYLWDNQLQLFRRDVPEEFAYSDGAEVESRLLSIIQNARDRGTFSQELADAIRDWPTEYHLSRSRHCLLRPLRIGAAHRVLELGCGCGALTRFLGESGAQVVAVEGSIARARITAERCRGLDNVRVFADNLTRFETDERFDYILLIGVLEYAAVFSGHPNPFENQLRGASRFLAPGGKLVVAIENELGLKYFNGCAEDHVGVPFFGVQDLYGPRTVRTFGRRQLLKQFAAAGLSHVDCYYPFPDYKLPSVVLSEQALTDADFDPVDLLARCQARDYTGSPLRSFNEALTFIPAHKNGLLADLSNSFLAVAMTEPAADVNQSLEIAHVYSVNRDPQFAVQTSFLRTAAGLQVLKTPLLPGPNTRAFHAAKMDFTLRFPTDSYVKGPQLLWRYLTAQASASDLEATVDALRPWMQYLLDRARLKTQLEPSSLASYLLAGDMLDCTPFNLVETENGLLGIDVEWRTEEDIPLGWVLARGILYCLDTGLGRMDAVRSVFEVMAALCVEFKLHLTEEDLEGWLSHEADFQAVVTGRPRTDLAVYRPVGIRSAASEIAQVTQITVQRDEEIGSLKELLTVRDRQIDERNIELRRLSETVAARDQSIGELNQNVSDLNAGLADLNAGVAALNSRLSESNAESRRLKGELDGILHSRSWRYTSALRNLKKRGPALRLGRYQEWRQLERDRQLVADSGLFDADWYLAQHSDVARSGVDPLTHYLRHGGFESRDPSTGFSSSRYLDYNPDVQAAHINPLLHYLRFGQAEGRQANPVVEEKTTDPSWHAVDIFSYMSTPIDYATLPEKIFVGVSSRGNFFMTEIARILEDAFRQLGAEVAFVNESQACGLPSDITILVVAPHEFFHLGDGPKAFERLSSTARMVMVNTEQPQTKWFALAKQYLGNAVAVLDIDFESARHLQASGFRAFALPLGYSEYIAHTFDGASLPPHELYESIPASVISPLPALYSERPIDVLFIGTSSPRRDTFFATYADYFSSKTTIFYLPVGNVPFLPRDPRSVDFATFAALLRRSKILLNIHRDTAPYLEWQRIVTLGIMNQTLVITDQCSPNPCIVPNVDYLEGPLAAVPTLCDLALGNIKAAESIAIGAYDRLREHYPMDQVLGRCWTALTKATTEGA